jgi:hypothetical protein
MLFFRSEESINIWCAERGYPRRPSATLRQLWSMALAWYADRLSLTARRPSPDEIRGIFSAIGLSDPFWDPHADYFV